MSTVNNLFATGVFLVGCAVSSASNAETPSNALGTSGDTAAAKAHDGSAYPACAINAKRYFAGACWAEINATIPSGTNQTFPNVRQNHKGSVNASCIAGKVSWSSGVCDAATQAAPAATKTGQPALSATTTSPPPSANYKIGTYYFPGWRDNQIGAPAKTPWTRIKPYPEREPMLGWYDDGNVANVEQQLKWMHNYGIDYVVFDWFWNGKGTELDQSVKAYLQTTAKRDVPFALLWANHADVPKNKLEFTAMVAYWIANYFNKPEYMRLDDKPVIFVLSHPAFAKQAVKTGQSYTSLLKDADDMAKSAGLKGIYFVGGTHVDSSVVKVAATSGYSAFSAYNYQGRADDMSSSYRELDDSYQYVWNWITANSAIPYIVPMTQGWDKRPWGGSSNPQHDLSGGSQNGFLEHLQAARSLMDANPTKTMRMGIICCWNEFGEGSFIEPTKRDGFTYLEQVRAVFGKK